MERRAEFDATDVADGQSRVYTQAWIVRVINKNVDYQKTLQAWAVCTFPYRWDF